MVNIRRSTYIISVLLLMQSQRTCSFSNLTNNDPAPLYSSRYPYEYLSAWERDYFRGLDPDGPHCERFTFSFSPFRQTANSGKNIDKETVELGDMNGRWNMLGLFYYTNPNKKCASADPCNLLASVGLKKVQYNPTSEQAPVDCTGDDNACPAATYICAPPGMSSDPTTWPQCPEVLNPTFVDRKMPIVNTSGTALTPTPQVGFFSIPLQYRKYGVRFEADLRIWGDIGIRIQTGAADITQNATQFIDLTQGASQTSVSTACTTSSQTCTATSCTTGTGCFDSTFGCKELIVQNIMRQRYVLAQQLGYNITDYHANGMEDTRIALYWQRIIPVNDGCSGWPFFLCTPFFAFEAIVPTSKKICPKTLFAVPLGNNGHTGLGFSAGFDFDFVESIEIGMHAGMTKWNTKSHCGVPVPTNQSQSGIYPFTADLSIKPGTNWTFSATINAHYFLDRLSAFGEYFVVDHGKDCIEVCSLKSSCGNGTPTGLTTKDVLVEQMRELSAWRAHLFNFGLTYDVSPHAILGFLWQAPIGRTNAYRSTTLMISATFRF